MSKHTKGPWIIKKNIIYGNDGMESIACVLDSAWPHGLMPDPKANAKRIVSCVNALEGLSDDALDGGWNFKSMSKYCKDIESQRDELLEALELLIDDLALRAKLRNDDCLDVSDGRLIKAQEAIAKAKGEV